MTSQDFEDAYARYHRFVRSVARRRAPDDYEDAVQETWLRVWRKASTWKGDAEFSTWLYSVARNAASDVLRRKRRLTRGNEPFGDVDVAGHDDPERAACWRERYERALAARETMPAHLRLTTDLLLSGATVEDIAATCGVRYATAKSRVHRARVALREFECRS